MNLSEQSCTWADPEYFPVYTEQWPLEIEALAEIYRGLQPRVTVEIGSLNGGTLRYWLKDATAGAQVYAIDPAPNFCGLGAPEGVTLHILPVRSDAPEALAILPKPVDFIFIDGDHSYKGVKYDWDTYGPLVRYGGVVAFHDIDNKVADDFGVPVLWQEIVWSGLRTVELRCKHRPDLNRPGGGIGVVYMEQY